MVEGYILASFCSPYVVFVVVTLPINSQFSLVYIQHRRYIYIELFSRLWAAEGNCFRYQPMMDERSGYAVSKNKANGGYAK